MKNILFMLLVFVASLHGGEWCPICGNALKTHASTHHTAKLHNDQGRHYCSLRCLVVDSQEYGIKAIKVNDYKTHTLIDANASFYVVGSSLKGVHSKVSKVAFANENDAKEFIKQNGGTIKRFEEAFALAQTSLKSDNRYFDTIKAKKIYPKGKKIYIKKCKSFAIELNDFLEIDELKEHITRHNLCPNLKTEHFDALALYLWEDKRKDIWGEVEDRVVVGEDEKCPVCGMFTYKYPRWAAQIFFKHNDHEHHLSFDGVKDLMKFYFNPNKWGSYSYVHAKSITKIIVTDYYSQKAIDATDAFYVIGSDAYGPMGHELIPFASRQDAQSFKADHNGKRMVAFDEINEAMVYKLDE